MDFKRNPFTTSCQIWTRRSRAVHVFDRTTTYWHGRRVDAVHHELPGKRCLHRFRLLCRGLGLHCLLRRVCSTMWSVRCSNTLQNNGIQCGVSHSWLGDEHVFIRPFLRRVVLWQTHHHSHGRPRSRPLQSPDPFPMQPLGNSPRRKKICFMGGTTATIVANHRSQEVLLLHFGATVFCEDLSVKFQHCAIHSGCQSVSDL